MRIFATTFLFLFAACQQPSEEPGRAKPVLGSEATEALKAKLSLYLDLGAEHRNEEGFVPKCDSLLFTSLSKVAGYDVDVEAAEDDGRWYRRPERECYENGKDPDSDGPGSHSDISKDQYLGLLWATWYEDKKTAKARLERMIAYGKSVDWKVGRGPVGSTYITPPLRQTMAEMLKALGGKEHKVMLVYPHSWPKGLKGYQAHLQVIHILLRKKVLGKISKKELDRIGEHYRRNPENALFSFAYQCFKDRNWTKAAITLLNEKYFPEDRLPTRKERCTNYLWERENDDDWKPCKGKGVHDGVDYMFASYLLLEELEE